MPCGCSKIYNNAQPIKNIPPPKYPCKVDVEIRCDQRLEEIINLYEREKEKQLEEEEKEEEDKRVKAATPIVSPCAGVKLPKKKQPKTISGVPYSRPWSLDETIDSPLNEFPKWFRRKEKPSGKSYWNQNVCPREPDDYEKSLWIPICEPPKKLVACKKAVDPRICVFCLGSLYMGGYLHELFEKTPLIKEQSKLYGDEISWRIGIRTRVIVHKSCYDSYIDVWGHKKQEGGEQSKYEFDLGKDEIEESDDSNCGEEKGMEEEEDDDETRGEGGKDGKGPSSSKKKSESSEVDENSRKQFFCLKKYKPPQIDSGK